eukprot:1354659-Amorphochlora_amoeboformis.AAC.2
MEQEDFDRFFKKIGCAYTCGWACVCAPDHNFVLALVLARVVAFVLALVVGLVFALVVGVVFALVIGVEYFMCWRLRLWLAFVCVRACDFGLESVLVIGLEYVHVIGIEFVLVIGLEFVLVIGVCDVLAVELALEVALCKHEQAMALAEENIVLKNKFAQQNADPEPMNPNEAGNSIRSHPVPYV